MRQIYQPKYSFAINGTEVLCRKLTTSVGLAGAIGSATITTTRRMLKAAGLTAETIPALAQIEIETTSNEGEYVFIFGGVFDTYQIDWAADEVQLFAKDYAYILQEDKETLASMNYENQTPSDIAEEIAKTFGFIPRIDRTPPGADGKPVYAGQYFNDEATLSPTTTELWALLQQLAKAVGFDCYVTPNKELCFKKPDSNQKQLELTWLGSRADALKMRQTKSFLPILNMRTEGSPRRHATFQVNVQSFDQKLGQEVDADCFVLDQEIIKEDTSTGTPGVGGKGVLIGSVTRNSYQAGTYSGGGAAIVKGTVKQSRDDVSSSAKVQGATGGKGYPVYKFRLNGLTNAQAHLMAEGFARDIARRRVTKNIIVDGYPEILVQQPITLIEGIPGCLDDFAGKNYEIGTISHTYDPGSDGYTTAIGVVSIPPGSTDFATQQAGSESPEADPSTTRSIGGS